MNNIIVSIIIDSCKISCCDVYCALQVDSGLPALTEVLTSHGTQRVSERSLYTSSGVALQLERRNASKGKEAFLQNIFGVGREGLAQQCPPSLQGIVLIQRSNVWWHLVHPTPDVAFCANCTNQWPPMMFTFEMDTMFRASRRLPPGGDD